MKLHLLYARLDLIYWDTTETALAVEDTQKGFIKPGGYSNIVGHDPVHTPCTVTRVNLTVEAARVTGFFVNHIQSGFDAAHLVIVGATAHLWNKSGAQGLECECPELILRLITEGRWDYALHRRSAAYELVSARRIRILTSCGVITKVYVESSLRVATLCYVERFFGWVTDFARIKPAAREAVNA